MQVAKIDTVEHTIKPKCDLGLVFDRDINVLWRNNLLTYLPQTSNGATSRFQAAILVIFFVLFCVCFFLGKNQDSKISWPAKGKV